jgi:thymidine kinase
MKRGEFQKFFIGTMGCGKTDRLITELGKLRKHRKKNVIVFKPEEDKRSEPGFINSRTGKKIDAHEIPGTNPRKLLEILRAEEEKLGAKFDIVAFDEVQFYPLNSGFRFLVIELMEKGYDIIAAGLDLDYTGESFGSTYWLTSLAKKACVWLEAYCTQCDREAIFPQRMVNNEPGGPQIMVGGDKEYEPRCPNCFEPLKKRWS